MGIRAGDAAERLRGRGFIPKLRRQVGAQMSAWRCVVRQQHIKPPEIRFTGSQCGGQLHRRRIDDRARAGLGVTPPGNDGQLRGIAVRGDDGDRRCPARSGDVPDLRVGPPVGNTLTRCRRDRRAERAGRGERPRRCGCRCPRQGCGAGRGGRRIRTGSQAERIAVAAALEHRSQRAAQRRVGRGVGSELNTDDELMVLTDRDRAGARHGGGVHDVAGARRA
jgi:hypothetical protein